MMDMAEAPFQDRISVSQIEQTEVYQQELPKTKNPFLQEMFKIMIEGIGLSVVSNHALYLLTFSNLKNRTHEDW